MRADLHVHSNYSDGNMSVEDLIKYAENKKLDVIAITDHDNLDSRNDISKIKSNVLTLVGVELSTYHNDENIHILGYFYNNEIISNNIVNYLEELKIKRDERVHKIINNLKKFYNIDIQYDDISKYSSGAIGRVHVAKAICEKYGCSINDAFDRYIGNTQKAYVPTTHFKTKDAIDFLHKNNAIAVIAHPKHIKKNDVEEIVKLGVDGIEVYYPENNMNDITKYLEIADKYKLLVTGGSDFHGIGIRDDLGTSTIKEDNIKVLLKKLNIEK